MNINVRGVFYGMKHQIPAIIASGGGAIVNTSSALGLTVIPNAAIYNASKFAVIGLTKTAAVEFGTRGVRVNAVCPAVIETDMTSGMDEASMEFLKTKHPIGRIGQASEVAAAVLFLCTPGAGFTTGVALPVDGGWTAA